MKSGGDMKTTPRIRLLTREELALWRHVTADVTPREKKFVCEEEMEPSPETAAQLEPASAETGQFRPERRADPQAQINAPETPLNPIVPLDRRLKRKLFSGKSACRR